MKINSVVEDFARNVAQAAVLEDRNRARAKLDEFDRNTPRPSDPDAAREREEKLLIAYARLDDRRRAKNAYQKIYDDFISHAETLPEPDLPPEPPVRQFVAPPLVGKPWWKCLLPWESITDWEESRRQTEAAWAEFNRENEQEAATYKQQVQEAYVKAFAGALLQGEKKMLREIREPTQEEQQPLREEERLLRTAQRREVECGKIRADLQVRRFGTPQGYIESLISKHRREEHFYGRIPSNPFGLPIDEP